MRTSLRVLAGAVIASLAVASFMKEAVARVNPGFASFTPYYGANGDLCIALPKEMIEIHERIDLEAEFKLHLPQLDNNPITRNGINCYVGSSKRQPEFLGRAARASLEHSTQKSNELHEQTKLKSSTHRAVRR